MPVKKELVNEFVWVKFHEHPVVDYLKQPVRLFDVSSEGYPDFPSDFIANGAFDYKHYCISLMESIFGLPSSQLSSFLDYQIGQLENPFSWLIQLDTFLENNCKHKLIAPFGERLNLLFSLVEERRIQHSGYVYEKQLIFKSAILKPSDERFDIVKVKEELKTKGTLQSRKFFLLRRRMDYLQEVENNDEAPFVKCIDMELVFMEATVELQEKEMEDANKEKEVNKIVFKGTSTELAKWMGGIKWHRNEKGDFLFDESTTTYARLAHALFCKSDGRDFNEDSIRKFLTKYNEEILNSETE